MFFVFIFSQRLQIIFIVASMMFVEFTSESFQFRKLFVSDLLSWIVIGLKYL